MVLIVALYYFSFFLVKIHHSLKTETFRMDSINVNLNLRKKNTKVHLEKRVKLRG
jgi:hypothetical protein